MAQRARSRSTSTSNFGVGRRESHDASAFYNRFAPPEIHLGEVVNPPTVVDEIFRGDSRRMTRVADNSVALVVTSPPYFAGKEYEEALGSGHVPSSYFEYLEMLTDVFAECVRTLEDGGRIAVNVANLGRRPYRSLASDVTVILQDRLRLLLRGEVIWRKAHGAGGSCAWGSFQSPMNPVLRDTTERIVIASKGRFDRALSRKKRSARQLPSTVSISKDEFMEATTDLWDIPPESATRVGHPAPFPVELPQRLIELYTLDGDTVLDPFIGSGSTAVAAVRTGRRYLGYDTEVEYVDLARRRVSAEEERLGQETDPATPSRVELPVVVEPDESDAFQARATREGLAAREWALTLLRDAGFRAVKENVKVIGGVEVNFVARDRRGGDWYVDVCGAFTSSRPGLRRTDILWKALGKAAVISTARQWVPYVLLSSDLPLTNTPGYGALEAVRGGPVADVISMREADECTRLARYAEVGHEALGRR